MASLNKVDVLASDEDKDVVGEGRKFLFFDSDGVTLTFWTESGDDVSDDYLQGVSHV